MTDELAWRPAAEWRAATHAERVRIGDHELVALQLAADGGWPEECRWEVFGPPNHEAQLATGQTDTFPRAKAEAERAWRSLTGAHIA